VIGEIDFRQADAEAAAAQATLLTVQQNRRNAESALAPAGGALTGQHLAAAAGTRRRFTSALRQAGCAK
jgi:outer membrane protein TolC